MKRFAIQLIVILPFILMQLGLTAQEKTGAKLEYVAEKTDLGVLFVDELEPVKLEIEFTNKGDEPLVVSSVRGCCGTRIMDYTKKPILPNEKGFVKIEFRLAPRAHKISRRVSVMSNDPDGLKVYTITGEVAERDDASFGSQLNTSSGPRNN